jgi:hypothetical protein
MLALLFSACYTKGTFKGKRYKTMTKEISIEMVKKYNEIVKATIGTKAYEQVALYHEFKTDEGKWESTSSYGYKYPISLWDDGMRFYLKSISGRRWLYMDLDGEIADRYLLEDCKIARLFFCEEV